MRSRGTVRLILANIAVFVALLVAAEGASSFVRRARSLMRRRPVEAIAPYLQHDAELGWSPKPGTAAGETVHVNARGFRSARETAPIAAARTRVVCSGDSFTFGDGVADAATWCAQLERIDSTIETVNLGVPGYGIDQAYLRYVRDGRGLGDRAHVLAFIDDDLRRMGVRADKPYFTADSGRLMVHNVPVPPFRAPGAFAVFEDLNLVQVAGSVGARLRAARGRPADGPATGVVPAILDALADAGRARGSAQILVRLPSAEAASPAAAALLAAATSMTAVDLRERFEALPEAERWGLLQDGLTPGSHLNAAGHAWVARALQPVVSAAVGRQ